MNFLEYFSQFILARLYVKSINNCLYMIISNLVKKIIDECHNSYEIIINFNEF